MTAALSLLVGIGVRAQSAQTGQSAQNVAAPAPQGPLAPEKFKNIQVLTDVRADELRPSMEYFTAALGVQCNFCHVPNQFDSDDRPAKKTARQMIQMVERFNGDKTNNITLTCATCHHGHQQPERTPPLAANMTPEEAAAFAARAQERGAGPGGAPGAGGPGAPGQGGRGRGFQRPTETVDQVVDKYVQAMGGSDALAQAKTRVLKGTVMTRDLVTSPITVQETASGNYRIDIDAKQGPIVRVSNGKDVWVQAFGNTHDLEGVQADQATRLADFGLPTNIKQRYASLTVGRYGNVDGSPTIALTGRVNDDSVEQLQFSRDTGLLVRRTFQRRTPFGALVEQVDYSDYHDVSGVKVPFSVVYTSWNQVTTEKISDAKINAPVDDSVFAKK